MKKINKRSKKIELSRDEQFFLVDSLKEYNPKKIVELGVFLGGTSSLILENTPKDTDLYSIDLCDDKLIGSYCLNMHKDEKRWRLLYGNYAYKFMKTLPVDIDCIFLDTDHVMPGEILDFLMVYPLLGEKCDVFIHDINLYRYKKTENKAIAPRMLLNILDVYSPYEVEYVQDDVINSNLCLVHLVNPKEIDLRRFLPILYLPWKNYDILARKTELMEYFLESGMPKRFVDELSKIFDFQLNNLTKAACHRIKK